jgi:hypothetical protein
MHAMKFRNSWLHNFLSVPVLLIALPLLLLTRLGYSIWWFIRPPVLNKERIDLAPLLQTARMQANNSEWLGPLSLPFPTEMPALCVQADRKTLGWALLALFQSAGDEDRPAYRRGTISLTREGVAAIVTVTNCQESEIIGGFRLMRKLVQLNGGSISVKRESNKTDASVSICLPLSMHGGQGL